MAKHIIIIEDNKELNAAMSMILEDAGYRVSAFTALTTIDDFAALSADLFIIAERLPVVSGHIICIMLHNHTVTRRIPQLLISASPFINRFAEMGEVNAYLKKPYGTDELIAAVLQAIR